MSILEHVCRVLNHNYPRPFDRLIQCSNNVMIGAEVGVLEGEHAAWMLKHAKIERLYLIDPYLDYDEKQVARAKLSVAFSKAQKRLAGKPVIWMRCLSTEADLKDLDFVYIDADHSYEAVKADIEYWWSRIKERSSVMGGHDFCHAHPGVVKAVTEFSVNNGLNLNVETPDWWIKRI